MEYGCRFCVGYCPSICRSGSDYWGVLVALDLLVEINDDVLEVCLVMGILFHRAGDEYK